MTLDLDPSGQVRRESAPEAPAPSAGLPEAEPFLRRDTNMSAFARWVADREHAKIDTYADLWRWSVDHPDRFWDGARQFLEIPILNDFDDILTGTMPHAQWFTGATTNFANMLDRDELLDQTALVGVTERGVVATVTHAEFRRQVASLADVFTELDVQPGDRIVGYLPNIVETIIAFYAAASVGAVWGSVGADYEPDAAIARLGQLSPVVLIGTDGYTFRGRDFDRTTQLRAVAEGIGAQHVILIPHHGRELDGTLAWRSCVERDRPYEPVQVPFDHPLWVLFSSGTTGAPKGIVHGHGGAQLELHKTLALHMDVGSRSRVLWATSPSWVIWNVLAAALVRGGCAVTFDGSPTHPDPRALWRVVSEQGVTEFGTSPAFLRATERAGIRPAEEFDLSALRTAVCTGSPLPETTSDWAVDNLGAGVPLISISGGTDVIGPFVGGVPGEPVVPGEIQARCLGVSLEAWSDGGVSLTNAVGELVVTKPMPSMPLRFWNDPDGSRLHDAYFNTFPGVWRHGDWITVSDRGTVVVHGRSDSTLNRNGIRMGSSDIYRALESVDAIQDSLVIGAELPNGGYWMPLFVVLHEGHEVDDDLRDSIKQAIRHRASPRHVPDEVIQVPAIPRTRTGKRLEIPIKRILQGADVDAVVARSAVDKPESLDLFARLASERATK